MMLMRGGGRHERNIAKILDVARCSLALPLGGLAAVGRTINSGRQMPATGLGVAGLAGSVRAFDLVRGQRERPVAASPEGHVLAPIARSAGAWQDPKPLLRKQNVGDGVTSQAKPGAAYMISQVAMKLRLPTSAYCTKAALHRGEQSQSGQATPGERGRRAQYRTDGAGGQAAFVRAGIAAANIEPQQTAGNRTVGSPMRVAGNAFLAANVDGRSAVGRRTGKTGATPMAAAAASGQVPSFRIAAQAIRGHGPPVVGVLGATTVAAAPRRNVAAPSEPGGYGRGSSISPALSALGGSADRAMLAERPSGMGDNGRATAGAPTEGDVFLDGAFVGRWLARRLAQQAGRPPSASPAFDPTRSPFPPGRMIGG
jgi:hypothetical protein